MLYTLILLKHLILLLTIDCYHMNTDLLMWITDFLCNRKQYAVLNGEKSGAEWNTTRMHIRTFVISALLSVEWSGYVMEHSSVPFVHPHMSSGKTADWIWTLFGMVNGIGLSMGVLDFGGDRRRGRGSLEGEFAASHCNQCQTLLHHCVEVRTMIELSFGEVSGVGPGIHVSTCLKAKGLFLVWFLAFFGIFVQYFTMAAYGCIDILIDDRLVCEKLTIFPYAEYIVEFSVQLAFLRYSQVQDRSGG